ncbi:phage tail protein [Paenibacillus cellulosilyticus]|uniref:phage tail protein n=1 Tax=Paenibacillus cellulosilyticus TaxID=375489 RepID=UPI00319DADA2
MFPFNFAPKGWAFCNGQTLQISQYQALYSLLGTTYGGNGQTTFALPDFRGRVPMHFGNGVVLGQQGGEESHTVTTQELPVHSHLLKASSSGAAVSSPQGAVWAGTSVSAYHTSGPGNGGQLSPSTIASTGGTQAHNNMQPYLTLSFCISLQGTYPSRS